jgi:hypothetical protein
MTKLKTLLWSSKAQTTSRFSQVSATDSLYYRVNYKSSLLAPMTISITSHPNFQLCLYEPTQFFNFNNFCATAMSVPMKTGIPLFEEKGRAPPKNNSDERPSLWVVRWTREVSEEQTEDVVGFITCYADTTICQLLKFSVDFYGAYNNINALKTEKVALTSQAESLLQPGQSRRSGPQKKLADPKPRCIGSTQMGG